MPSPTTAFLFVVALIHAPWATGQALQPIERIAYQCPAWEEAVAHTDAEQYSTKDEYVAACDGSYVMEKIGYRSDGLAVIAYYYRPRSSEATPRPVVVFNRGSYVRPDIAPELLAMFHRLAEAGFAVVAPMYRGSDGGEGRDELGGADLNDLMNIVPVLSQLDSLDARNIFLYGESRGGMMVFQAIRDGFPARAAATFGAFTDLAEMTSSDPGLAMARTIWPDFEDRRDEIVFRRSAVRWPERLELPLLLMHGGSDDSVPLTQALELATQLAKMRPGREFGLIVFPRGNHSLTRHQVERDHQAVAFFRRHLMN